MKYLTMFIFIILCFIQCEKRTSFQVVCSVCKTTIQAGYLKSKSQVYSGFRYDPATKVAIKDSICNSCLAVSVPIQVGEITRCPGCGKILADSTETIKCKRIDSLSLFPRPIRYITDRACSRHCKIKGLHPSWSAAICEVVAENKIIFGLTRAQVLEAWGAPMDIRRTVTPTDITEHWYYKAHILHFKNDSLQSWED